MADTREAVYCTLVMSDSYLPGAMVLAHSLRDNGTKAKIVVLITPDSLQLSTIEELKSVYDEIIPVSQVVNSSPANLYLMDRPDLISTFTKIELWRQTQYKQIVYIDADVVAIRAPDELLTLDTQFAAVPDIGWPDCFNSGVLVLRPNVQTYNSLLAFAQRGISFDGADQGLLNMHFKDWHRLSFSYNCTPSGHYQYIPAFRHFQSTISLVHYIGQKKPWTLPRQTLPVEGPHNQLLARWWAVYDRHYKPIAPVAKPAAIRPIYASSKHTQRQPAAVLTTDTLERPVIVSKRSDVGGSGTIEVLKSAIAPVATTAESTTGHLGLHPVEHTHAPNELVLEAAAELGESLVFKGDGSFGVGQEAPVTTAEPVLSSVPQYVRGEEHVSIYRHPTSFTSQLSGPQPPIEPLSGGVWANQPAQPHEAPVVAAEPATREHYPSQLVDTNEEEPEHYATTQPPRAVSPPMMIWDAARAPPPVDSKPEAANLPTQTYTMSQSTQLFQPPKSYPEAPKDMYYELPPKSPALGALAPVFPWEGQAPAPSRVFFNETRDTAEVAHPEKTSLSEADRRYSVEMELVAPKPSTSVWESYTRTNAWDELPEIQRYMQSLRKPSSGKVQVVSGSGSDRKESSSRLIDFPSEIERPSLPVTPAPIQRGSYQTGDNEDTEVLQGAEGVPKQEEWNPLEQLEKLHQHHCKFLERAFRDISKEEDEQET
ncbi:glycogenin glucosyltransferase [Emydomyces testavorans]|uniref:glycogenin glucosyltransferase n=1 Tax=Emydomyces testavorans TaxID=2070801 RepID=A0AAF0IG62_9EURO|nr:glycogenin glucosyltransferase [Emydomyces testavorans]